MTVSRSLKNELLAEARRRCCIHRKIWVHRVIEDNTLLKWEPLDIHHVVFQSCGGSDDKSNLVPLCPSCHRMLHDERRNGNEFISDRDLLHAWEKWKGFAQLIPSEIKLGDGETAIRHSVVLDLYGINFNVIVDKEITYANFRVNLLEKVVNVFSQADPDFPFVQRRGSTYQWIVSHDDKAEGQWNEVTAKSVLATDNSPLVFSAPVFMALEEKLHPFWSMLPHHRLM
jgi:hypothetical protein